MTNGTRLSDSERQKGLRALRYEQDMLRATTEVLVSGNLSPGVIHNAVVESFVIHARLLIAFFYGPHCKDDIRPTDWLDESTCSNLFGHKSELLERTYSDANKWLAHLTATRLAENKKNWDSLAVLKEIETLLDRFFRQVEAVSGPAGGASV